MLKQSLLFFILMIVLSGCGPLSINDQQKKKILAVDPDFQKVLDIKNTIDLQMQNFKTQFLSEKNIYELKLRALRGEFQTKRANFNSQTQEIKRQLGPYRQKIDREITLITKEFNNKRKSCQTIQNMLNQAKSIMEGKNNYTLLEEDKIQWQQRLNSLAQEFKAVNQEIALIKERLYILKLKQRLLAN